MKKVWKGLYASDMYADIQTVMEQLPLKRWNPQDLLEFGGILRSNSSSPTSEHAGSLLHIVGVALKNEITQIAASDGLD